MLKKIIFTLLCTGVCGMVFSQVNLDSLKINYQADKRNVKVVKEYAEALKDAKMKKDAEEVVKEYMSRCPVIQIEDKDTYLLINEYVFTDPYSNVFEHGLYAVKKMKWDREEKKLSGRQETLRNIFKGWGSGVSGGDEIDKRYEVLMLLSNNLKKEINKRCVPGFEDVRYVMPDYDGERIERLNYLVNRGELLGQDGMRLKLKVAEAMHKGDYSQVINDIRVATEIGITDVDIDYVVRIMSVVGDVSLKNDDVNEGLNLLKKLCEQADEKGKYYCILGKYYSLAGDKANGDKYTGMWEAYEAEKEALWEEMMKGNN